MPLPTPTEKAVTAVTALITLHWGDERRDERRDKSRDGGGTGFTDRVTGFVTALKREMPAFSMMSPPSRQKLRGEDKLSLRRRRAAAGRRGEGARQRRKVGATFERSLADANLLFLRRDRAEPSVVLGWRVWAGLLHL